MRDSGIYQIPQGAGRVEIPHSLGVAPNIVTVEGLPDGAEVFTLADRALLVVLPPDAGACAVEWSVGYEQPPEPEREMDEEAW